MRRTNRGRRRALAVLSTCALAAMRLAVAQDPRVSDAQRAARDWLALSDAGDPLSTWKTAGAKFQAAMPPAEWGNAISKVRTPLGALVQRTLASTQTTNQFAGQPPGDYALLVYRTAFANKTDASETVTMEREADGQWRVIGYSIR